MVLYVLLFAGLAAGKYVPSCMVGEWSEWSACKTGAQPYSFPAPQGSPLDVDRGAMAREGMMAEKSRQAGEKKRCIADDTCPEYAPKSSIVGQRMNCVGGMAGEYPCSNVDMLSMLSFTDMGAPSGSVGNDIWGWTDPSTGREYAIMGMDSGTGFVDITDGANPRALAFLPTQTTSSTWRDIKVVNDHAFIGSEAGGHGLQVYDLRQLRNINPPSTPTVVYERFGNTHNIVSLPDQNLIIAVGATQDSAGWSPCAGGLHIIDVSNPQNPNFLGCYDNDGYTHDAECVVYNGPDTTYQGRDICFGYNEDTLTIVDITNTLNPAMISRTGYTGAAYTHQGWLSENHAFLLLDDEQDEMALPFADAFTITYVWDVTSLANPRLVNAHSASVRSIDHNQYILNGLSYQANYESGLRIVNPNWITGDINEVGFFDVFPSRDTALFNGAWSVYPYYASGKVVVSSIEYGLFVLQPNVAAMAAVPAAPTTTSGMMTRYRDVMSKQLGAECPALVENQPC